MRPAGPRDPVAGPDSGPESPFPVRLSGPVIKGFGRGSKELGIPTANIPPEGLDAYPDLQTGVYYGVVALDPARFVYDVEAVTARTSTGNGSGSTGGAGAPTPTPTPIILPAVLSIGYNPFYKNTVRSVEIHIMPPLSAPSPTATGPATGAGTGSEDDSSQKGQQQSTSSTPAGVKFHKLPDFYGTKLNLLILGYIRPEYDYVSVEALVEDIRVDCEVARQSLMREKYACYLGGGDGGDREVEECRKWLMTFE